MEGVEGSWSGQMDGCTDRRRDFEVVGWWID